MSDDLLDEATRLADEADHITADCLRALVERVREAEADAISLRSIVTHETQMREDAESRAAALSETRTRILAKHPHAMCDLKREEVEAERTCYSDECGEPCQSWQAMKRAELAEYKRQAEVTGQRLGEARGKLDAVREAVDPSGKGPSPLGACTECWAVEDVLAIIDADV